MEIRQLQTFVQAAQLESFSKTAEPWMLIFVRLQVESERTTFPA